MKIDLVGKKCSACNNPLRGDSIYAGSNGQVDHICPCGHKTINISNKKSKKS